MSKLERLKRFFIGKPLDPFNKSTRSHIALITFFAWVGIGADGLSSACYGPEEAFKALGQYTHLAIFLALATGVTVFLIGIAYLQVIELFPNGGGGYRVASTLIGPRAGLVSGSALIIDYVLTIAISIAGAVDALFSVIDIKYQPYKLPLEILLVMFLTFMNLRGMKESIKFLLPIFMGFIISYLIMIVYGIFDHYYGLEDVIPDAVQETKNLANDLGWFFVLALFFKAFSLGGGTYTGLEAVSNSLHNLAEPKVRTGKNTMMAVAASLAIMATGIILLYLLWDVQKVEGQTLNATTFKAITADWVMFGTNISVYVVGVIMFFSAGILIVAGNTGFIAGPAVLASMAVDRWMPHLFSALSSRLVTKNGILLMGVSAAIALIVTQGSVYLLVVLYSINVFLTFTLSLFGICKYRIQNFKNGAIHIRKFIIPFLALLVSATILITTVWEKFFEGGWKTIFVTGIVVFIGLMIKRHYLLVQAKIEREESRMDRFLDNETEKCERPKLEYDKPTACFMVSETSASGLKMVRWVENLFPGIYKNFVFVSVGEIDTEEFVDEKMWNKLRRDTRSMLKKYVDYSNSQGYGSTYYHAYGTDVVNKLTELTDRISEEFPNTTFFATKLISDNENFITQMLHNQTGYILQRRLHNKGKNLIVIPFKL
jgi:amino acid transporter